MLRGDYDQEKYPRVFESSRLLLLRSALAARAIASEARGIEVGRNAHEFASTIRRVHQHAEGRPDRTPSVAFVGDTKYEDQPEIALRFDGLGEHNSKQKALAWQKSSAMPDNMPVGVVDYGLHGFEDVEELTDAIKQSLPLEKLERIRIHAVSTGGLFALGVISRLGIPVSELSLNSAPSGFDNVRHPTLSRLARYTPKNSLFEAAMLLALRYETTQDTPHAERLRRAAREVEIGTQTPDGSAALNRAAHKINLLRPSPQLLNGVRSVIDDSTHVYYIRDQKPFDDWVQLDKSEAAYKTFFLRCNAPFQPISGDFPRHADNGTALHLLEREIIKRSASNAME